MSTEDFVIRLLIVAAVVADLYFILSPYQQCMRDLDMLLLVLGTRAGSGIW